MKHLIRALELQCANWNRHHHPIGSKVSYCCSRCASSRNGVSLLWFIADNLKSSGSSRQGEKDDKRMSLEKVQFQTGVAGRPRSEVDRWARHQRALRSVGHVYNNR